MSPAKSKPKANHPSVQELSFEQAQAELENIITSLEASQLNLDETLALFERGQALTKHCIELLDKADLRVKILSGDKLVDVDILEQGS